MCGIIGYYSFNVKKDLKVGLAPAFVHLSGLSPTATVCGPNRAEHPKTHRCSE